MPQIRIITVCDDQVKLLSCLSCCRMLKFNCNSSLLLPVLSDFGICQAVEVCGYTSIKLAPVHKCCIGIHWISGLLCHCSGSHAHCHNRCHSKAKYSSSYLLFHRNPPSFCLKTPVFLYLFRRFIVIYFFTVLFIYESSCVFFTAQIHILQNVLSDSTISALFNKTLHFKYKICVFLLFKMNTCTNSNIYSHYFLSDNYLQQS